MRERLGIHWRTDQIGFVEPQNARVMQKSSVETKPEHVRSVQGKEQSLSERSRMMIMKASSLELTSGRVRDV